MKRYVLGFAFDNQRKHVALIIKNRPEWQAGKCNGIGGHIETTDVDPAHAMSREFMEETGVTIAPDKWQQYCVMQGFDSGKTEQAFEVVVFKTFTDDVLNIETMTDETVFLATVGSDTLTCAISNVTWLVHMALDENYNHPFTATIEYHKVEETVRA